eukprot:GFUD01118432.1.p1 GENE.GFUD01118432.1~~GFUD01118432.1.p1  ORF type:complete len:235 (+),score=67.21 GFUD01118432.1:50-754(+)
MEVPQGELIAGGNAEDMELCEEVSTVEVEKSNAGKENGEKVAKVRTEPLSGHAFFLKLEKQKIHPSKSLDMEQIELRWKMMTSCEKEPYEKLSREDKISLGPNYRRRETGTENCLKKEKGKLTKPVVEKTQTENCLTTGKGKLTKPVVEKTKTLNIISLKPEPTLCCLLEEVQDLDTEISSKLLIKQKQCQDLMKLKFDSEVKVTELAELDGNILSFRNKCKVLEKKKRADTFE